MKPLAPEPHKSQFTPLSKEELKEHQHQYLNTPPEEYHPLSKMLFKATDMIFPQGLSYEYFAFTELVARVPYMAWEHAAHIAQTQTHIKHKLARKIQERVLLARDEQDNEFWHLLIMVEFLEKAGYKRRFLAEKAFPQILSFIYYHLSWILFVVHPKLAYRLNSEFEDHAMRSYAKYVADNPQLETELWESRYKKDYGYHETVADVLRQIAHDEEQHKVLAQQYQKAGKRFSNL